MNRRRNPNNPTFTPYHNPKTLSATWGGQMSTMVVFRRGDECSGLMSTGVKIRMPTLALDCMVVGAIKIASGFHIVHVVVAAMTH